MATIRDIAARTGLSKSAVSLALRESPRIPAETRELVLAAARALNYRPNPMFSHMMRSVRATGPMQARATLGILHGFAEPQPARSVPYHAEWLAGARERAEALGYAVDELWMKEPGMSARRLSDIIRARGISALLIAPLPERRGVQLDWEHFTAVTAGYSLVEPRLTRAVPHHQQAMLVCLQQLANRGYRRIGFALEKRMDPLARFNLSAPFEWFQSRLPRSRPVPVLELAGAPRAAFVRWLRRHRPEAVILTNRVQADWIRAEKLDVPQDIGVVATSRTVAPEGFCCVDHQPRRLGAAAVDLLIGQLNRGETGIPANPKTVFTDVTWSEGRSLRVVGPPLTEPKLEFL
ncbi:MAG TPA: LacI family DNA-binding transcriptional regulator [Opitutaceae bacterium]|nr:LacI family DNA-binding transcriptional regulator [Opitutaceae bacterium]HRJ46375.1 LacI family DNA-binding transcriptional regulator [Opitutaceae bacterium]